MTALRERATEEPHGRLLAERVEAEAYVASVCFKHGPPRLIGTELEWTVHHTDDPARPLDPMHLATALGQHSTTTLRADCRQAPLPAGSPVTVEPGGQVEISALPQPTLDQLADTVLADQDHLCGLLAEAGLTLGTSGLDPHRRARRILDTPRYRAMERAFAPLGAHGITMMGATAGLQVCLDAGEPSSMPLRWAAATALGPPLLAAFATSSRYAGADTGWASARMRAVLGTSPARTMPLPHDGDPVAHWVHRALDTTVLCLRGTSDCWDAPSGLTFADWVAGRGGVPRRPTTDDLDYHLSTLFPPVRPRGYLEIRYLDAQPGHDWLPPLALVAALFSDDATTEAALAACEPVADAWYPAARHGLAHPAVAAAAAAVLELGLRSLPALAMRPERAERVNTALDKVLRTATGKTTR